MFVTGVHGMVGFAADLCMHVLVPSPPRRRLAPQRRAVLVTALNGWQDWMGGSTRRISYCPGYLYISIIRLSRLLYLALYTFLET
jgi:hypothetical protein